MCFMSPRDLHKLLESYFVFWARHQRIKTHLTFHTELVLVTADRFENQELDVEVR